MPDRSQEDYCPNGHPVLTGSRFCNTCGAPVVSNGPIGRSANGEPVGQRGVNSRVSFRFPDSRPGWLGKADRFSFRNGLVLLALGAFSVNTALLFIGPPRLVYFVTFSAMVFLIVSRTRLSGPAQVLGAFAATVLGSVVYDLTAYPLIRSIFGYNASFNIEIRAFLIESCWVAFALVLLAALSPDFRGRVMQFVKPLAAFDALRSIAVTVIGLLAGLGVILAFTGGFGFYPLRTAETMERESQNFGSEHFPSGYALPTEVAEILADRFRRQGRSVTDAHCEYFAPAFGPPPVYNCRFQVDGEYHDNVQGTGRPDGSFSWNDYTQGVRPLN